MRNNGKPRALLVLCAAALGALALEGCREEEQGRVLYYEKGSYPGETDAPLAEDTLGELRHRATRAY